MQDRDESIGWTNAQRAQRLKLVVQLRRNLLLHEAETRPNLASEVLAAALRNLPAMWKNRFGFEPLLAESFSDIEAYAGTCYRASGWQAAGFHDETGTQGWIQFAIPPVPCPMESVVL